MWRAYTQTNNDFSAGTYIRNSCAYCVPTNIHMEKVICPDYWACTLHTVYSTLGKYAPIHDIKHFYSQSAHFIPMLSRVTKICSNHHPFQLYSTLNLAAFKSPRVLPQTLVEHRLQPVSFRTRRWRSHLSQNLSMNLPIGIRNREEIALQTLLKISRHGPCMVVWYKRARNHSHVKTSGKLF